MHYARLNHSPVARSAPLVGAARGSAQRPKPCTGSSTGVLPSTTAVLNSSKCTGTYYSFSTQWYYLVGTDVQVVLLVKVFQKHILKRHARATCACYECLRACSVHARIYSTHTTLLTCYGVLGACSSHAFDIN